MICIHRKVPSKPSIQLDYVPRKLSLGKTLEFWRNQRAFLNEKLARIFWVKMHTLKCMVDGCDLHKTNCLMGMAIEVFGAPATLIVLLCGQLDMLGGRCALNIQRCALLPVQGTQDFILHRVFD
jgi:hypothetical protein